MPQQASNDDLSDKELLRYARQVLLDTWDIDAQLNLKNSRVLIIGMGGLGCPVAETLTRSGVGHIYIVDDDKIEESNLQRQSLFNPSHLGQSKAKTACNILQTINELITIDYSQQKFNQKTAQTIAKNIGNFDLLIDCTDNFKTRYLINEISLRQKIPLLSASAIAMTGQLALFEPSKKTGCYYCLFPNLQDERQSCATSGVLASTTAVIGNLQAHLALQFLGLKQNPLLGKLLLWDGVRFKQTFINYHQNTSCKICACPTLS